MRISDWSSDVCSSDLTVKGPGKRSEARESAFIPGSNTPKPPGFHIQSCPGCHFLTSSIHVIRARLRPSCAMRTRASSTDVFYCACQVVKRVLLHRDAVWARPAISPTVTVCGFSRTRGKPLYRPEKSSAGEECVSACRFQ